MFGCQPLHPGDIKACHRRTSRTQGRTRRVSYEDRKRVYFEQDPTEATLLKKRYPVTEKTVVSSVNKRLLYVNKIKIKTETEQYGQTLYVLYFVRFQNNSYSDPFLFKSPLRY